MMIFGGMMLEKMKMIYKKLQNKLRFLHRICKYCNNNYKRQKLIKKQMQIIWL